MPAFQLVATIVREADGAADGNMNLDVVDGRIVMVRSRLASQELWRSLDRGVTWTFHTITGAPAATGLSGFGVFGGLYWLYSTFDDLMYRTSYANPGPVWSTEAVAGVVNGEFPQPGDTGADLFSMDNAGGRYNRRDNAMPGTWIDLGGITVGSYLHFTIPDTNDMFGAYDPGFTTVRLVRITPAPFGFVSFDTGNPAAHTTWPRTPGAVLNATDWWVCSDQGNSPGTLWQTVNGGGAWTARTVPAGFWADVPAIGAADQQVHGVALGRVNSRDWGINVFFNNLMPAQHIRNARAIRYNSASGEWEQRSDRLNDGFPMMFSAAGFSSVGLDLYLMTYDTATATTRVYRFGAEQDAGLGLGGNTRLIRRSG